MTIHITETPFLKNIQYLRRRHGISQKDMAEQLGCSLSSYKKRFEGEVDATFSVEELLCLCIQLFVKPEQMICLDLENCIDDLDRGRDTEDGFPRL